MADKRAHLEEIARRGDPEEWLRILLHEATRANNAEDSLRVFRDALRLTLDHHAPDCDQCRETRRRLYGPKEGG